MIPSRYNWQLEGCEVAERGGGQEKLRGRVVGGASDS